MFYEPNMKLNCELHAHLLQQNRNTKLHVNLKPQNTCKEVKWVLGIYIFINISYKAHIFFVMIFGVTSNPPGIPPKQKRRINGEST